ncbi:MAG: leucine-rich repeat protein [Clostridia bacterium]|nr:leucine-rich repeat protein [Clostridia bacterium]
MQTAKKWIAIFLSVVFLLSAFPLSVGATGDIAEENHLLGDVDADEALTSADARLLLRVAAKLEDPSDWQRAAGDMNEDGKIRSADARLALSICALLDTAPEGAAPAPQPDFDEPYKVDGVSMDQYRSDDTLTVTVSAADASGLEDCVMFLRYDPEKLEYVSQDYSLPGALIESGKVSDGLLSFGAAYINACEASEITLLTATFRPLTDEEPVIDYTFTSWNREDISIDEPISLIEGTTAQADEPTPPPEEEEPMNQPGSGDVNGDGYLTSADARYIVRVAAKLEALPDENFADCDMNGNGKIQANDARLALRICMLLEYGSENCAPVPQPDFDTPIEGENMIYFSESRTGNTLSLTVTAAGVSGLEDGVIFIRYDADKLEYADQTQDLPFSGLTDGWKLIEDNVLSYGIVLINQCPDDSLTLFTATFSVLDGGDAAFDYTFTSWNGVSMPASGSYTVHVDAPVDMTDAPAFRLDTWQNVDRFEISVYLDNAVGFQSGTFLLEWDPAVLEYDYQYDDDEINDGVTTEGDKLSDSSAYLSIIRTYASEETPILLGRFVLRVIATSAVSTSLSFQVLDGDVDGVAEPPAVSVPVDIYEPIFEPVTEDPYDPPITVMPTLPIDPSGEPYLQLNARQSGDTVTVDAYLINAAGLQSGTFRLDWDPAVLEYVSQYSEIPNAETGGEKLFGYDSSATCYLIYRVPTEETSLLLSTFTLRVISTVDTASILTFSVLDGDIDGVDEPAAINRPIDVFTEFEEPTTAEVPTTAEPTTVPEEEAHAQPRWSYEDGTLTVGFEGRLSDYYNWNGLNALWAQYRDEITKLVIEEGAVEIAGEAFSGYPALTEVVLPNSLRAIGYTAFSNCRKLSKINLPEGLESINNHTFYNCAALTEITLPQSLTELGYSAFSCTGLTSVTIPGKVKTIPYHAFYGCEKLAKVTIAEGVEEIDRGAFKNCAALKEITIPASLRAIGSTDEDASYAGAFVNCCALETIGLAPENKNFRLVGGVLFSADGKLIQYPLGSSRASYSVPEDAVEIARDAFAGSAHLTEIKVPAAVKSIGAYAFYNCSVLTTVQLPDALTKLNDRLFANCPNLADMTVPKGVTAIGNGVFAYCEKLADVKLPDGITEIGSETFRNCKSLTALKLPSAITEIPYNLFANCASLESMEIPNGVTVINSGAFANCEKMTTVSIPDGVTTIDNGWSENGTFAGCRSLNELRIPASLTEVSPMAFCGGVKKFTVSPQNTAFIAGEDGVLFTKDGKRLVAYPCANERKEYKIPAAEITYGAFKGSMYLEKLDLSAYAEDTINDGTFSGITSLKEVNIPKSVTVLGYGAFKGCTNLSSVVFDGAPVSLGAFAFSDCPNLKEMRIPASVTKIDDAFVSSGIEKLIVDENNKVYASDSDGCLTNKAGTELLLYPSGKKAPIYRMPENYKTLNARAFYSNFYLTNLDLSAAMEEFDGWTLWQTDIKALGIPKSVKSMENPGLVSELSDIYYGGSEKDWNDNFGKLLDWSNANIHFNAKMPDPPVDTSTEPSTSANPTETVPSTTEKLPESEPSTSVKPTETAPTETEQTTAIPNVMPVSSDTEKAIVSEDTRTVKAVVGQTAEELKTLLGGDVSIVDKDGNALAADKKIGTGAVIRTPDGKEYTVVVPGDTDGDGKVAAGDARKALRASAKLESLDGAFGSAADVSGDGKLKAADARTILRAAAKIDKLTLK